MAFWNIDVLDGGKVTLQHIQAPLSERPVAEKCGEGDLQVLPDLEAWVCDQALPFDIVHCPHGTFMRQTQTNRNAIASA